jgi:hypothetical protein
MSALQRCTPEEGLRRLQRRRQAMTMEVSGRLFQADTSTRGWITIEGLVLRMNPQPLSERPPDLIYGPVFLSVRMYTHKCLK